MMQELKGNIRVFCRVRPLLADDAAGAEAKVISYPTSTESLGRAIDLMQNGKYLTKKIYTFVSCYLIFLCFIKRVTCQVSGAYPMLLLSSGQKHSFTFDKVFMPDASQQEVFVEISQLVQSALDGYKVVYMAPIFSAVPLK